MTGISTISTAYSKVRQTTKNRVPNTVSEVVQGAFVQDTTQSKTPTCECPNCGEITPLSIQIINLGESKADHCTTCHTDFQVTFTENKEWEIE